MFLILALDDVEWSASGLGRLKPVPIVQEAVWATERKLRHRI